MSHEGPDHHERVDLTAYERHQIELIEQTFASQNPPSAPLEGTTNGTPEVSSLWLALVIASAWVAAFSVVFGVVPLTILSVLGVSVSIVMCWHSRGT